MHVRSCWLFWIRSWAGTLLITIKPWGHAINHRVWTLRLRIRNWHELWPGVLESENDQIDSHYYDDGIKRIETKAATTWQSSHGPCGILHHLLTCLWLFLPMELYCIDWELAAVVAVVFTFALLWWWLVKYMEQWLLPHFQCQCCARCPKSLLFVEFCYYSLVNLHSIHMRFSFWIILLILSVLFTLLSPSQHIIECNLTGCFLYCKSSCAVSYVGTSCSHLEWLQPQNVW